MIDFEDRVIYFLVPKFTVILELFKSLFKLKAIILFNMRRLTLIMNVDLTF